MEQRRKNRTEINNRATRRKKAAHVRAASLRGHKRERGRERERREGKGREGQRERREREQRGVLSFHAPEDENKNKKSHVHSRSSFSPAVQVNEHAETPSSNAVQKSRKMCSMRSMRGFHYLLQIRSEFVRNPMQSAPSSCAQ